MVLTRRRCIPIKSLLVNISLILVTFMCDSGVLYCKENFRIVSVCQTDKQQTDWNWPMTVNKLYMSLPANHITAKQTNHVQQTRLYNIIDWQLLFTWLWRWLPHRLSKRQSPTIVLFRTTLTRTITLYELLKVTEPLESIMVLSVWHKHYSCQFLSR